MFPRQATYILLLLSLLFGMGACAPSEPPASTPTASPRPTNTVTPLPPLPTLTATPNTCLYEPGQLQTGQVPTNGSPTNFIIYLPPCYDFFYNWNYPVLYLLNGLPMDNDPSSAGTQWVRIGAPTAADSLIQTGQYPPFIMVFPEDRYWNVAQGTLFGQFLVNDIIPYIDQHYRTIADRPHRAVGGLSRGGGWAFQLSLTRPDLFGSVGLHSPAIFQEDRQELGYYFKVIPFDVWPRIYIDSGDNDRERGFNMNLEALLTTYNIPHEWHLNTGEHNEPYWREHVLEYLIWYADGFQQTGDPLPTLSPTLMLEPPPTPTPEAAPPSPGAPTPSATP